MKSLWKSQKMVEEPGAPWRETASTGPIPQCTCAGTETRVCPEQTTVQLLRYSRHEHACEPPPPPTPVPGVLATGEGPSQTASSFVPPPVTETSSRLTYLLKLFENGPHTKCYLISCKDGQSRGSSSPMLGFAGQIHRTVFSLVCSNLPFWVHDYPTYRMTRVCTHLAS